MDTALYQARRRALRVAVPDGIILLLGNNDAPRNYAANIYPFRQDSHFLYFVGAARAGLAALLLPEGFELLCGPAPDPDDVVWSGPGPTLAEVAAAADGPYLQLWGHRHGTDAMFLALMQRNGNRTPRGR